MDKIKKIFKKDKSPETSSTSTSKPAHFSSTTTQPPPPSSAATSTGAGAGAGSSTAATTGGGADVDPGKANGVLLHTNMGDITIVLFADKVPKTTKNFATLAATHKYDNVIFHRIIANFMIQGGDPTGTGTGGTSIYNNNGNGDGTFEDEFHPDLKHTGKGILSMANSGPGTNGSQFFICLGATSHLDGKHTVFGQVVDGMDVVDAIGAVETDGSDRPLREVKIVRAEVFST